MLEAVCELLAEQPIGHSPKETIAIGLEGIWKPVRQMGEMQNDGRQSCFHVSEFVWGFVQSTRPRGKERGNGWRITGRQPF